jgi:hypothetical protein
MTISGVGTPIGFGTLNIFLAVSRDAMALGKERLLPAVY